MLNNYKGERMRNFLSILLLVFSFSVKGQNIDLKENSVAPKKISGMNAIMAIYNYSVYGNGIKFGYSRYFKNKYSLEIIGAYNFGKVGHTAYKRYCLEVDGKKNVLNTNNFLFINIGGTLGLGNENIAFEENQESSKENFLYEIGINAEAEIYVLPMMSINFGLRQVIYGNSRLGERRFYLPFTVRFYY